MTKEEIQKRLIKNGNPLSMNLFDWNANIKTLSIYENNVVIDLSETVDCGDYYTINCGHSCTINCQYSCTIDCGAYCTINCGDFCTVNCWSSCTINCGAYCTLNCGDFCVCIRKDIFEFFEIPAGVSIKLNKHLKKGWTNNEKK